MTIQKYWCLREKTFMQSKKFSFSTFIGLTDVDGKKLHKSIKYKDIGQNRKEYNFNIDQIKKILSTKKKITKEICEIIVFIIQIGKTYTQSNVIL